MIPHHDPGAVLRSLPRTVSDRTRRATPGGGTPSFRAGSPTAQATEVVGDCRQVVAEHQVLVTNGLRRGRPTYRAARWP